MPDEVTLLRWCALALLLMALGSIALLAGERAEHAMTLAALKRSQADVRHFKSIAYKAEDNWAEQMHACYSEVSDVIHRMQGEIDACKGAKK
jgi:hypothetical protein